MFNKSVDSILKVFTQAINDLNAVAEAKGKQIDNNRAKVQLLEAENAAAKVEMNRAQNVRAKLESIVSQ